LSKPIGESFKDFQLNLTLELLSQPFVLYLPDSCATQQHYFVFAFRAAATPSTQLARN